MIVCTMLSHRRIGRAFGLIEQSGRDDAQIELGSAYGETDLDRAGLICGAGFSVWYEDNSSLPDAWRVRALANDFVRPVELFGLLDCP